MHQLKLSKKVKCTGCDYITTRHLFLTYQSDIQKHNAEIELHERMAKPYTCRICKNL